MQIQRYFQYESGLDLSMKVPFLFKAKRKKKKKRVAKGQKMEITSLSTLCIKYIDYFYSPSASLAPIHSMIPWGIFHLFNIFFFFLMDIYWKNLSPGGLRSPSHCALRPRTCAWEHWCYYEPLLATRGHWSEKASPFGWPGIWHLDVIGSK